MELKKKENKDISKFRTLFRNVGLVLTLLLTITAFEWKWEEVKIYIPHPEIEVDTMIHLPNIDYKLPPAPEPPKPQSKVVLTSTLIEVIETELVKKADVIPKPNIDDITSLITSSTKDEIVDIPILYTSLEVEEEAVPTETFKTWYKSVGEYCFSNLREQDKLRKGKVYISFIIEKDGAISSVKVMKGIHKRIDALVIKAILKSGKWFPAKMGARPVRQKLIIPISFN